MRTVLLFWCDVVVLCVLVAIRRRSIAEGREDGGKAGISCGCAAQRH